MARGATAALPAWARPERIPTIRSFPKPPTIRQARHRRHDRRIQNQEPTRPGLCGQDSASRRAARYSPISTRLRSQTRYTTW